MLITLVIIVLVIVLAAILNRRHPMWDEEEFTTTTVREPDYNIVGGLQRQIENGQFFVTDPADGKKIWVNSNDDLYEDADGRVWRLA